MLFAALNAANGEVFGLCQERHRHQEWLKFLRLIDQTIPPDLELHVICDNSSTHKHDRVLRWLDRYPRFHMHFTPASSSWLNMVERFFRICHKTGCTPSFAMSKNASRPLETASIITTKTPSPSSGRPAPPICSRRSNGLAAPYINVDLNYALN